MPGKPLSKFLKAKFLGAYLADVLDMAGPGTFASVASPKGVLASSGPAPDDFDPYENHNALVRELALGGEVLGRVAIGQINGGDPAQLEPLMEFMARSLEELIFRESVSRSLADETLEQYRELALTQRATLSFNSSMKLADVARSLLNECREASTPAGCGMVFLMDAERDLTVCFDSFGPLSKVRLRTLCETRLYLDIMAQGRGEIINDLAAEPRWSGEIEEISSLLIFPLVSSGLPLGALVLAGIDDVEPFHSGHLKRMGTLATVAGIAMSNAIHFEQIQKILTALMQTMATAIDSRDRLTAGHSHRVARYAQGLMQVATEDDDLLPEMHFSAADLQEIYYAGLLHDVGKIGVREEVLTKATRLPAPHLELIGLRLALWGQINDEPWEDLYAKLESLNRSYDISGRDEAFVNSLCRESLSVGGRTVTILSEEEREKLLTPRGNLTPEEWNEIKRHPAESHRILQNIPFTGFFPSLLTTILQHHERLDGSGYPAGAGGSQIIPQSRIIAITDVYDSLRRDRHYKKALSQDMALRILREEAAQGKLDKRLVDVFCAHVDKIERALSLDTSLPQARELIQ